jgi:hypothetical protein
MHIPLQYEKEESSEHCVEDRTEVRPTLYLFVTLVDETIHSVIHVLLRFD